MTARFRVCRVVAEGHGSCRRSMPDQSHCNIASSKRKTATVLPAPHSRQALTNRPHVRHLEVIPGLSAD